MDTGKEQTAKVTVHFILICDSDPTINAAGISQTLFNLCAYKFFQPTVLLLNGEMAGSPGFRLQGTFLHCLPEPFRALKSRLGKWLNPWLIKRQLAWRQNQKQELAQHLPKSDRNFVLVSTSVPGKLHLAWCLMQRGYTVIPYFMDDWLAGNPLQWKGGNIQQVAQDILQAAPCWLMISRQLEKILRERYRLEKKPCLVVHNPAPDVNRLSRIDDRNDNKRKNGQQSTVDGQQIIYAGSIWPMHADALIATAKAIQHLNKAVLQEGKSGRRLPVDKTGLMVNGPPPFVPNLTIYTSEAHWNKYKTQLAGPGVVYGGWKTYHDIHAILQDAWLLLCTASFDEQHKAFSDSSVQTKLTDYMATGRAVLFVGPADAASGVFVEEHDIGFTMGTNQPADIAARLEAISNMPAVWERKAGNGRELAASSFGKSVVQQRLYDFLERHAMPAQITRNAV